MVLIFRWTFVIWREGRGCLKLVFENFGRRRRLFISGLDESEIGTDFIF